MLLETLSIFIGFVGIILVLSLFVTALVQFIQNVLRLRAKNLRVGLQSLIEKLEAAGVIRTDQNASSKQIRDKLIDKLPFVPKSGAGFFTRLLSPTPTWISKDELIEYIKTAGGQLTDSQTGTLSVLFQRMEDYLSKRFILEVRIITIVCAVIVAAYFQVSTPALLKRLSNDADYRARAERASEGIYREGETLLAASTNYQNVSDLALEQLTAQYPEYAALLEPVSGTGTSRGEIVAELEFALSRLAPSQRDKLIKEYDNLLEASARGAVADARSRMAGLTERLAAFDIAPWQYGWSYLKSPANIVGILATAALLAFGAPFWFERLRELIQLRDALKPKQTIKTATVQIGESKS